MCHSCLLVLQCGDCSAHASARQQVGAAVQNDLLWPSALLPKLGKAFPTLNGVDVADCHGACAMDDAPDVV